MAKPSQASIGLLDLPDPVRTDAAAIAHALGVDPDRGLSSDEVARRLAEMGPNELRSTRRNPLWRRILAQFTDPLIRAKIKPTVEIMAALPSVVIGFLAGLYLAAVVERNLVPVLLMIPLMPLLGTSGVLIWRALPVTLTGRMRAGAEIVLILPLLIVAGWLASVIAPAAETWFFGGDIRLRNPEGGGAEVELSLPVA